MDNSQSCQSAYTATIPLLLDWIQPIDFPHKLGICECLFGRAIEPHRVCWIKTGAGLPWKLDLTNPTHRWIVYGKYEGAAFLDWAKQFLPKNGVVVDSGANIGQMVQYLAQWVPEGQVLAFEPGAEAANWLAECLEANSRLPVELIRCGLGRAPAQLKLHHIGLDKDYGHGAWSQISETEGEPIYIVRLGDELKKRSIDTVDLWKLDVEGYEIVALQGAEDFLQERRIQAIYAELSNFNGEKIHNYLSRFGYVCYTFQRNGKLRPACQFPEHTYGLFLPN